MISPLQLASMLILIVLPFVEITLLILVGQWIGLWPTLGLLVLSAFAGMAVIRRQGLSMFSRMFDTMGRGGLGVASLVDSYAVILAGCLLIIPGFATDALGLVLLIPPVRRWLLRAALPGFIVRPRARATPGEAPRDGASKGGPVIIEGTYRRIDDDEGDAR